MDVAASSTSFSPSGSADTVNAPSLRERDTSPLSPGKLPVGVVARRRVMKSGAVGSPVRRSPRLSSLPPPQPPLESQRAQDPQDDRSDDDSESIDDVALHLSREETPENDVLPQDEPSSVLASRILRAHDNPSPPPQDLAHPGINYTPGKDGRFPLPGVSVPPSPFRPINILEGLSQSSDLVFGPSHTLQTPLVDRRTGRSEPSTIPKGGFVSPEHRSPVATDVNTECVSHVKLASANTIPSSFPQCIIDELPSQSSQHSVTRTSPVEVSSTPPTQAVEPSPVLPTSDNRSSAHPLPSDAQSTPTSPPPDAETFLLPSSNENANASPAAETTFPGGQDTNGKESSSTDNNNPLASRGQQADEYTEEVSATSHQRLKSLSPRSSDVLAALCFASDSTSPIEQNTLPPKPIHVQHPPSTPPQTPSSPMKYADYPRSSVQRPVIAPTPMRANSGTRRMISPAKLLSSETSDIGRTPAQRVPIATALACGTPSSQRTIQLSAGLDQSQHLGRFPIRTPVFTRPALDGPSRSPAKRIPVTDSTASPARNHQSQFSPIRFGHRARSTSVEPRPLGPILVRSRSVEPSATSLKPGNHDKLTESIFPTVPIPPKSNTKLPFPLVSGQKSNRDLPPPIPEEHETADDTKVDSTSGSVTQGNVMSQLKQSSASSRIPRMGRKPYSRPQPRDVKLAAGTTTAQKALSRVPPFRKNHELGSGNTEGHSTQSVNDQHVVGSLKRKRGADAPVPPDPQPLMVRQVVPGILGEKYAPKLTKTPQVQVPSEPSPSKAPQPLRFRKVVDGMLSARYPPAKADRIQTEPLNSTSSPPIPDSPLSDLSSSSDDGPSGEKPPPTSCPVHPGSEVAGTSRTDSDVSLTGPHPHSRSSLGQDAEEDKPSGRPRRTSRTRKPAQQQYVLDVFNVTTSTRPPPTRRKPSSRTEGDGFMGMSATALKALTTSNTAKNQQTVAVLATEVIRKDGLRPESPTVKARTILQKQRDERDKRRKERAEKRARLSEDGLGTSETEGQNVLGDHTDHEDENDYTPSQKHRRGPGDDEDYETPERSERTIEPLRLEGVDRKGKPMKQVKWHRGLSTAIFLDEVDLRPKSLPKDIVIARGCLAPTSKNLPLDTLGNLIDADNRPYPELAAEHIVVKKYLYDNDIEPEPIPPKVTRSKSKKGRS